MTAGIGALRLNTGADMPAVGLGVFRASPEETGTAVKAALSVGYRHVDTAQVYGNEAAVGLAIRESEIDRADIFVTTKVAPANMAPGRIGPSVKGSISALGFVPDLVLLHWPQPDLDLPGKSGEHQLRNQEVFYGKREQTDAGISA